MPGLRSSGWKVLGHVKQEEAGVYMCAHAQHNFSCRKYGRLALVTAHTGCRVMFSQVEEGSDAGAHNALSAEFCIQNTREDFT